MAKSLSVKTRLNYYYVIARLDWLLRWFWLFTFGDFWLLVTFDFWWLLAFGDFWLLVTLEFYFLWLLTFGDFYFLLFTYKVRVAQWTISKTRFWKHWIRVYKLSIQRLDYVSRHYCDQWWLRWKFLLSDKHPNWSISSSSNNIYQSWCWA